MKGLSSRLTLTPICWPVQILPCHSSQQCSTPQTTYIVYIEVQLLSITCHCVNSRNTISITLLFLWSLNYQQIDQGIVCIPTDKASHTGFWVKLHAPKAFLSAKGYTYRSINFKVCKSSSLNCFWQSCAVSFAAVAGSAHPSSLLTLVSSTTAQMLYFTQWGVSI